MYGQSVLHVLHAGDLRLSYENHYIVIEWISDSVWNAPWLYGKYNY